ncbi:hypothetical protein [Ohtaekwangia koreensis]|uniref:PE-PGRS family protein n=1 Tax=Ohtaekwangia koreensis TaxID=688867 RepID=A0A1T5L7T7_9BACT|nr:hypothetical protein [Ohtaekwangia koreensis]SKC71689.1 hypothetical protein SAMN05660236_2647 [Ohtaekwangia koreensis]
MKKVLIALVILANLGCSKKEAAYTISTAFERGEPLAELKKSPFPEVSDMAASINNPGKLWVHNDSGNKAEVFLIDKTLQLALTCKLKGVDNRDWEDLAVGPGPDPAKNYIYVGDIGDNAAAHTFKYIYRFEEPVWHEGEDKMEITAYDKITFRLPGDMKDTETLFIDPKTKDLFIVSKREEPVYLYTLRYPYSTTDTLTATEVMSLPFREIVAGDFSDDGKEILLKNYEHIYRWSAAAYTPAPKLLKGTPEEIPYEEEPQGESIAWDRNGSGFYTLSEKNGKKKSYLYFYKRK